MPFPTHPPSDLPILTDVPPIVPVVPSIIPVVPTVPVLAASVEGIEGNLKDECKFYFIV